MTDARLMDADCIHGVTWYECEECEYTDPMHPEDFYNGDEEKYDPS